ncbi:MAG: bifunctional glutamate N-acetyltransferase/amino-acid acetyltransferase ArgJ [Bacteroidota bacterium]
MQQTKIVADKINAGITAPKGFKAAGIHCGIKKSRKDLALIVSDLPATAAAVFTLNKVQAAPVIVSKKHLNESETFKAIIVNSGNANACTGVQGYEDAVVMADETANTLGVNPKEIFVASTGVIGEPMPIEKIVNGIHQIADRIDESEYINAAEAIMTTDTFVKSISSTFMIDGKEVSIGGIAKGSGMIHPNMATMLGFITTDAAIEKNLFQTLLKNSVDKTFNRIVVDGDTSTNDMVIALANGASGISIEPKTEAYKIFEEQLYKVLKKLALDIVRDGEGATKLIEITVQGALSQEDAIKAAKTVALSPLVKTAIHGEDANWGRIIAAVGYSGIEFDPAKFEISINNVPILKKNYTVALPNSEANKILKSEKIDLMIKLNYGGSSATCWTCDFSEEYVKINGSYRT